MLQYSTREFSQNFNVSRETLQRLEEFVVLLERWNKHINLVSRTSLKEVWRRHIADSAQLADVIPSNDGPLVDIGTGAGLPGMILAIMGFPNVHLIEASNKKCAFLREAARVTRAPAEIHNIRLSIDAVLPDGLTNAGIITARAVSPLPNLLDIVCRLLYDRTCCVFPKGAQVEDEIGAARLDWEFDIERVASKVESGSAILLLRHIRRRERKGAGI